MIPLSLSTTPFGLRLMPDRFISQKIQQVDFDSGSEVKPADAATAHHPESDTQK